MKKQTNSRTKWSKPTSFDEESASRRESLPKWVLETNPLTVTTSESARFNKKRPKSAPLKNRSSRKTSAKDKNRSEPFRSQTCKKRKSFAKRCLRYRSDGASSSWGGDSDDSSVASAESLCSSKSSCHDGGDGLDDLVSSNITNYTLVSTGSGEGKNKEATVRSRPNSKTTTVVFKHSSSNCSKPKNNDTFADRSRARSRTEVVEVECFADESDDEQLIQSACTSDSCKEENEDESDVTIVEISPEGEEQVMKDMRNHHNEVIGILQQREASLYEWQINEARKLLEAQRHKRIPEKPVSLVKTAEVCVAEPLPTEIPELSTLLKEMTDADEKCAPVRENLAVFAKFELERTHSNKNTTTLLRRKKKRVSMPRLYSAHSSFPANRSSAPNIGHI